jgi:hypothetical protein
MSPARLARPILAMLLASSLGLLTTAGPADAAAVKENRVKFSAQVAKDCLKNGGNEKACAALALAADPPLDGITDVSISFQYDPSGHRWCQI